MRILVSAATRHGATGEIAKAIAATLITGGHEVVLSDPERVDSLGRYDAAVIGSAIYAGQWLAPAKEFVERYENVLAHMPVWVFSSGPIGDPPKPEGEPAGAVAIAQRIDPRDHRIFPGRIDPKALGFGERAVVKLVKAPEGDYRPWAEIEAWARSIAAELNARQPVPA